ncbi:MAG: hypothetical protein ACLFVB_06250 [Thermoplasmata archaeon]
MEIKYDKNRISFEKELTVLDELALDFSHILQENQINHVFVAGYVAILFGRSRVSEDVDIIVENISKKDFLSFWEGLDNFHCHNTWDPEEAYEEYLDKGIAIRFSREDVVIPNIEFKFASTRQQNEVLGDRIIVELNGKILTIAPLESQISYKLYLGTKKDIEDAKYLYEIFEDKIDYDLFKNYFRYLNINLSDAEEILGDKFE